MNKTTRKVAHYHLPGLFEFYELYRVFLQIYREHREFFYDWCDIGSIYGAPEDCIWGGGRTSFGNKSPEKVLELVQEYDISARLTFSNSLLRTEHLSDRKCNELCDLFGRNEDKKNGVIIHSELLLDYLKKNYQGFYFVSSTTKVITDFGEFQNEVNRDDFLYVVPDFRLNKDFDNLVNLFLDIAENNAERNITMYMNDWKNEVENALKVFHYDVLEGKGSITHKEAIYKATSEYEKYRVIQDKSYVSDFDKLINETKKIESE